MRAGRPPAHEFTCYSDLWTRLVMAPSEQQAVDYLTATEVATNVSTTGAGGMNSLEDRSNVSKSLAQGCYVVFISFDQAG